MKSAYIFIFCITFLSNCSKPNTLDNHAGIWAVNHGYFREMRASDAFYLIVNREQIESGNIILIGQKLVIQKAELCCPFISGYKEFYVPIWNDSMLVITSSNGLPRIHGPNADPHDCEIKMMKSLKSSSIAVKSIGLTSLSVDSISPINYMIDIENENTVYFQEYHYQRYSSTPIHLTATYKKRLLSQQEKQIYRDLMKYHRFDTTYMPYYGNGCRFGIYFVDPGFSFQGKNYPMNYYGNDGNCSNQALQGFLLTLKKNGKWQIVKGTHDFCSRLEHYHDRQRTIKPLVFSIQ